MGNGSSLNAAFRNALNSELAAVGCGLRVADQLTNRTSKVLLIDDRGHELGWVPDHADPQVLLAFEQILRSYHRNHTDLNAK